MRTLRKRPAERKKDCVKSKSKETFTSDDNANDSVSPVEKPAAAKPHLPTSQAPTTMHQGKQHPNSPGKSNEPLKLNPVGEKKGNFEVLWHSKSDNENERGEDGTLNSCELGKCVSSQSGDLSIDNIDTVYDFMKDGFKTSTPISSPTSRQWNDSDSHHLLGHGRSSSLSSFSDQNDSWRSSPRVKRRKTEKSVTKSVERLKSKISPTKEKKDKNGDKNKEQFNAQAAHNALVDRGQLNNCKFVNPSQMPTNSPNTRNVDGDRRRDFKPHFQSDSKANPQPRTD